MRIWNIVIIIKINKLFFGINRIEEIVKSESRYFSRVGKEELKNSILFVVLNLM